MNIRGATKNDSKHLSVLAIATWVDTYADEGVNDVFAEYALCRFTPEKMNELIDNSYVVVAETDFGLVGYAVVSGSDDGKREIETIYILPKYQGKGIGQKLMDSIISKIEGDLWLKCADYNPRALNFYRRYGFIEKGETWFELAQKKYRCLIFELSHNMPFKQNV